MRFQKNSPPARDAPIPICPSALFTNLGNVHHGVRRSRTATLNGSPATKIEARELIRKSCHDTRRVHAVLTAATITTNCAVGFGLSGDAGGDQIPGASTVAESTIQSASMSATFQFRSHYRKEFASSTPTSAGAYFVVNCAGADQGDHFLRGWELRHPVSKYFGHARGLELGVSQVGMLSVAYRERPLGDPNPVAGMMVGFDGRYTAGDNYEVVEVGAGLADWERVQ
jgi:hypothetical protein